MIAITGIQGSESDKKQSLPIMLKVHTVKDVILADTIFREFPICSSFHEIFFSGVQTSLPTNILGRL